MIAVERSFAVATQLPTVVGYLTDWGNSREWDPGTVTCTKISDGPVGLGTEWRNALRLLHRTVIVDFRLEHLDDDRLVFSGRNRGATSTDTITCTPRDGGGTSIHYDSVVHLHRLARLASPLLRREFERIGDELIGQMTAALERQV
ncbi:polyketide cyclase/dehydrase/lipid transport protein [Pseudonocardia sediminis]|uniref:Polyketide cyclase/dehydrase/lipid transport protein n=1 Tax=Pseudonocardia sediminis TaxID=1397368 RepID=A0A4Q7UUU7_PSEST|nr:SRPBCC family protein [Pseudonocardia sediminis]RZT84601.1 polyketide cyclase/dehydrase/lipid transport protein [Pseudonocardia sediminis]